MKTKREAKDTFIAEVFSLKPNLVSIFGEDGPGHIADIGACDGLSAIGYAKMFPKTIVRAIEPRQDNFEELCENISEYEMKSRIYPIKCALGNKTQEGITFFESRGQAPKIKTWNTGNKSSSLLPPLKHLEVHPWCKFVMAKCFMTSLDNLLLEPFYLMPFDFIHIDVQGAELMVFKGGQEMLKSCKAIWCEVSNVELYKGQAMKLDVVAHLANLGFDIEKDTCGRGNSGDCLFVRR